MKTLALALATTAIAATGASAMSVESFDRNGDRFASFAEVSAANPLVNREQFRELDVNRDGRLSAVEIDAPGAEAILSRGERATGTVRSVADISGGSFATWGQLSAAYPGLKASEFRIIDANKDNRVSSNELYDASAQAILGQYETGSSVLVSLDAVDTDGSGFASLGELQSVYTNLDANDLRQIDVNRDGRISFNELYAPGTTEILGRNK
jgi:Ca2+-binding EF-hand superfamily protein